MTLCEDIVIKMTIMTTTTLQALYIGCMDLIILYIYPYVLLMYTKEHILT